MNRITSLKKAIEKLNSEIRYSLKRYNALPDNDEFSSYKINARHAIETNKALLFRLENFLEIETIIKNEKKGVRL